MPRSQVLGVLRNIESDELIYDFSHFSAAILDAEPTKRLVVSPLGVIQPVVVTFKVFIQELCRVGVTWDEPLQGDLLQLLVKSLRNCQPISVPRYYTSTVLIAFSYVVSMMPLAQLMLQLYFYCLEKAQNGQSRVTPLKPQTIP